MIDIRPLIVENAGTKTYTIEEKDILNYEIKGENRLLRLFENSYSKIDQYILCAIETEDC